MELADDWLTAKRALESAAQAEKGHSDRARRADLARWAVVLGEVRGRSPTANQPPTAGLVLSDFSEAVLLGAMAAAKQRWSDATVARMLSTLRGFTRWLHRAGHLPTDPLDDDLLRAPARAERRPKAPDAEDVERMLSAAKEAPSSRQRMYWPTRDAALLRFLTTTGARAEEACGVTIGELDRRAERPIWRVGRAKGGKPRDVPLPRTTLDAIDDWLAERVRPGEGRRALKARRADPLFVRPGWCGDLPTGPAWSCPKRRLPMPSATTTASPWPCAACPRRSLPSSWATPTLAQRRSTPPWPPHSSSPPSTTPACSTEPGLGPGGAVVGPRCARAVPLRRAGPPVRELPR